MARYHKRVAYDEITELLRKKGCNKIFFEQTLIFYTPDAIGISKDNIFLVEYETQLNMPGLWKKVKKYEELLALLKLKNYTITYMLPKPKREEHIGVIENICKEEHPNVTLLWRSRDE